MESNREWEHGICSKGLGVTQGFWEISCWAGGTDAGGSYITAPSEALGRRSGLLGTMSLLRDVSGIMGPVTHLPTFTFNNDLLPLSPPKEWNIPENML